MKINCQNWIADGIMDFLVHTDEQTTELKDEAYCYPFRLQSTRNLLYAPKVIRDRTYYRDVFVKHKGREWIWYVKSIQLIDRVFQVRTFIPNDMYTLHCDDFEFFRSMKDGQKFVVDSKMLRMSLRM